AQAAVEELLTATAELARISPRRLVVARDRSDFRAVEGDRRTLRLYKAWSRLRSVGGGGLVRYRVPHQRTFRWALERRTQEIALDTLRASAERQVTFGDELLRTLTLVKQSLASLQRRFREDALDADLLADERERVTDAVLRLQASEEHAAQSLLAHAALAARQLQQDVADDLDRLDLRRHARRERKVPRATRQLPDTLREAPARAAEVQHMLIDRAALAPRVGLVQIRLAAAIRDTDEAVRGALTTGVIAEIRTQHERLRTFHDALVEERALPQLADPEATTEPFDETTLVEALHQALQAATASVPEVMTLPREATIAALRNDPLTEIEVAEVSLRRHLQFLVDSELVGPAREILAEVPRAERHARSVAEDVTRLVTINLTELATSAADEAEIRATLAPVVDHGLQRLTAELARLEALPGQISDRIGQRLSHVIDLTSGSVSLGTAESFESQGRRVADLSRFGRLTRRLLDDANQALVSLTWRRSSGLLLARSMGEERRARADGITSLMDACSPRPSVLEALPFYYRQLFLGRSAVHSAFWVGRGGELEAIERALGRYARGIGGALIVTGAPGSGRTALLEVAVERFLAGRRVVRVTPPTGGSCDPAALHAALEHALRLSGSVHDLLDGLADGSVVVLHDAELWWERSADGLRVLELLVDVLESHGDRLLFVVEAGEAPLGLWRRLVPIEEEALAVVRTGPVDAETLKDIVLARHKATGLTATIDGRSEDELSGWNQARLFTALFDQSDGNIAAALHGWVAAIEGVDGSTLTIRTPIAPEDEALSALSTPLLGLLVEIVLHGQLTPERLARITGEGESELRRQLGALRRLGLVEGARRELIELSAAARGPVVRHLRTHGWLP
ncbi:MAG: ATP-binding protein, partial [Myxococcales bacterium]|nr:ATP-binding protein [Myxococcales bacterium]